MSETVSLSEPAAVSSLILYYFNDEAKACSISPTDVLQSHLTSSKGTATFVQSS